MAKGQRDAKLVVMLTFVTNVPKWRNPASRDVFELRSDVAKQDESVMI